MARWGRVSVYMNKGARGSQWGQESAWCKGRPDGGKAVDRGEGGDMARWVTFLYIQEK